MMDDAPAGPVSADWDDIAARPMMIGIDRAGPSGEMTAYAVTEGGTVIDFGPLPRKGRPIPFQAPEQSFPAGHIGSIQKPQRQSVLARVALMALQEAEDALKMIAEGRTPDGLAHRMDDLQAVAQVALERVSTKAIEAMIADMDALR